MNLCAMKEIDSIITGTVVCNVEPRRKITWTARLKDGQDVSASSCYKSKKTRHTREDDIFKTHYSGSIRKKECRQLMQKNG